MCVISIIMIDEDLLEQFGGSIIQVKKGDVLFEEGDTAKYFY